MDDIHKRRLNHLLHLWFCATDPQQRAEFGKQVAELQAQWRGKEKAAPGKDPGGVQSDSENTTNQGGALDEL